MAQVLVDGARVIDMKLLSDDLVQVDGLENQLVNEVAQTAPWQTLSSWTFRRESHINILEETSLLRMLTLVAKKGGPRRVIAFGDSCCQRSNVKRPIFICGPVFSATTCCCYVCCGRHISRCAFLLHETECRWWSKSKCQATLTFGFLSADCLFSFRTFCLVAS